MGKAKIIDYQKAMQEYDKSHGRKPDDTIIPLADKILPDGGVDYQAAINEYQKNLKDDQQKKVHSAKK